MILPYSAQIILWYSSQVRPLYRAQIIQRLNNIAKQCLNNTAIMLLQLQNVTISLLLATRHGNTEAQIDGHLITDYGRTPSFHGRLLDFRGGRGRSLRSLVTWFLNEWFHDFVHSFWLIFHFSNNCYVCGGEKGREGGWRTKGKSSEGNILGSGSWIQDVRRRSIRSSVCETADGIYVALGIGIDKKWSRVTSVCR